MLPFQVRPSAVFHVSPSVVLHFTPLSSVTLDSLPFAPYSNDRVLPLASTVFSTLPDGSVTTTLLSGAVRSTRPSNRETVVPWSPWSLQLPSGSTSIVCSRESPSSLVQ